MSESCAPISLKIDIDTHEGMRDGVPVLLDILEKHGVRATFCLSFGPDNAGKAIFRLFKDPAFLKKMLTTGAPSLYGWRTILSGTLLPARPIATAFPQLVREILDEGHEAIVHAWDHRYWQDHLPEMTEDEIRTQFRNSFDAFETITGKRPHAVAAPGWQATEQSLKVEAELDITYASDLREGPPCFIKPDSSSTPIFQIPTTGPCIEELLAAGITEKAELSERLLSPQKDAANPVLAVHAEVEGGLFSSFFDELMPRIISQHREVITLGEMAEKLLADRGNIPERKLTYITLPGRAGKVASSKWPH